MRIIRQLGCRAEHSGSNIYIDSSTLSYTAIPKDTPNWLKPYLAAAQRSGLTAGWPETETGSFNANQPVTGAEAAVLLQNALDLSRSVAAVETAAQAKEDAPVWAADSLQVMASNGIQLSATQPLNRGEFAQMMYAVSQLAEEAPGMTVIRMQQ